jgi:hypothetical protein
LPADLLNQGYDVFGFRQSVLDVLDYPRMIDLVPFPECIIKTSVQPLSAFVRRKAKNAPTSGP